jgi:DNA-binding transcriptional LysR family regulator
MAWRPAKLTPADNSIVLSSSLRLDVGMAVTRDVTPSALSACQCVAHGLGLAIVDPFTFAAASRLDIVARPIRPAIEVSFGFFFPANRPRSALVNAFIRATRSVATSTPLNSMTGA